MLDYLTKITTFYRNTIQTKLNRRKVKRGKEEGSFESLASSCYLSQQLSELKDQDFRALVCALGDFRDGFTKGYAGPSSSLSCTSIQNYGFLEFWKVWMSQAFYTKRNRFLRVLRRWPQDNTSVGLCKAKTRSCSDQPHR